MTHTMPTESLIRHHADRFAAVVDAVPTDRWTAPSPCEDWTVAGVVTHVVDTQRDFVQRAGLDLPERPDLDADPAAGWHTHWDAMTAVLDDPEQADTPYSGMFGETTVAKMIDQFYGFDLVVHRTDVARGAGVEDHLSEEELGLVEQAADGFGEHLTDDGVCHPPVAVGDDASREDRLLARLGRDPRWTP